MLIGCHLSIGKGFPAAIDEAESLGMNAMQVFSHNASSWRMKEMTIEIADSFRKRLAHASVEYVVIHTMYLLNLASPDDALYERSILALVEEIRRAGMLGVDQIVTHIGAHKGSGIDAGIARARAALDRALATNCALQMVWRRRSMSSTARLAWAASNWST